MSYVTTPTAGDVRQYNPHSSQYRPTNMYEGSADPNTVYVINTNRDESDPNPMISVYQNPTNVYQDIPSNEYVLHSDPYVHPQRPTASQSDMYSAREAHVHPPPSQSTYSSYPPPSSSSSTNHPSSRPPNSSVLGPTSHLSEDELERRYFGTRAFGDDPTLAATIDDAFKQAQRKQMLQEQQQLHNTGMYANNKAVVMPKSDVRIMNRDMKRSTDVNAGRTIGGYGGNGGVSGTVKKSHPYLRSQAKDIKPVKRRTRPNVDIHVQSNPNLYHQHHPHQYPPSSSASVSPSAQSYPHVHSSPHQYHPPHAQPSQHSQPQLYSHPSFSSSPYTHPHTTHHHHNQQPQQLQHNNNQGNVKVRGQEFMDVADARTYFELIEQLQNKPTDPAPPTRTTHLPPPADNTAIYQSMMQLPPPVVPRGYEATEYGDNTDEVTNTNLSLPPQVIADTYLTPIPEPVHSSPSVFASNTAAITTLVNPDSKVGNHALDQHTLQPNPHKSQHVTNISKTIPDAPPKITKDVFVKQAREEEAARARERMWIEQIGELENGNIHAISHGSVLPGEEEEYKRQAKLRRNSVTGGGKPSQHTKSSTRTSSITMSSHPNYGSNSSTSGGSSSVHSPLTTPHSSHHPQQQHGTSTSTTTSVYSQPRYMQSKSGDKPNMPKIPAPVTSQSSKSSSKQAKSKKTIQGQLTLVEPHITKSNANEYAYDEEGDEGEHHAYDREAEATYLIQKSKEESEVLKEIMAFSTASKPVQDTSNNGGGSPSSDSHTNEDADVQGSTNASASHDKNHTQEQHPDHTSQASSTTTSGVSSTARKSTSTQPQPTANGSTNSTGTDAHPESSHSAGAEQDEHLDYSQDWGSPNQHASHHDAHQSQPGYTRNTRSLSRDTHSNNNSRDPSRSSSSRRTSARPQRPSEPTSAALRRERLLELLKEQRIWELEHKHVVIQDRKTQHEQVVNFIKSVDIADKQTSVKEIQQKRIESKEIVHARQEQHRLTAMELKQQRKREAMKIKLAREKMEEQKRIEEREREEAKFEALLRVIQEEQAIQIRDYERLRALEKERETENLKRRFANDRYLKGGHIPPQLVHIAGGTRPMSVKKQSNTSPHKTTRPMSSHNSTSTMHTSTGSRTATPIPATLPALHPSSTEESNQQKKQTSSSGSSATTTDANPSRATDSGTGSTESSTKKIDYPPVNSQQDFCIASKPAPVSNTTESKPTTQAGNDTTPEDIPEEVTTSSEPNSTTTTTTTASDSTATVEIEEETPEVIDNGTVETRPKYPPAYGVGTS